MKLLEKETKSNRYDTENDFFNLATSDLFAVTFVLTQFSKLLEVTSDFISPELFFDSSSPSVSPTWDPTIVANCNENVTYEPVPSIIWSNISRKGILV